MVMAGGHSGIKDVTITSDPKLQEKVSSIQSLIEAQLGETFQTFQVVEYRQQVVAGTVYHFKIVVSENPDDDVVQAKAFEPLPFEQKPMELMRVKKAKKGDALSIMN